jgi:hypothetical protein
LKELEIEQILTGTLEKELYMLLNMAAKTSQLFGEESLQATETVVLFSPDSLRIYHQKLLVQP